MNMLVAVIGMVGLAATTSMSLPCGRRVAPAMQTPHFHLSMGMAGARHAPSKNLAENRAP